MIVIGCEPMPVQLFLLSLEDLVDKVSTANLPQAPDPANEQSEFASKYVETYESIYRAVMYNKRVNLEVIAKYCQYNILYEFCSDAIQKEIMRYIHYFMQFSKVTYESKRGII